MWKYICVLLGYLLIPLNVYAANVGFLEKNVREYLAYTFGTSNVGIEQASKHSLQSIHQNAQLKPDQMVRARIFFHKPVNKLKLVEWVNQYGFDVESVRYAIPITAQRNFSGEITSLRVYQGTFLEIVGWQESRLITYINKMATQGNKDFLGVQQYVQDLGMAYYYMDISINYASLSKLFKTSLMFKTAMTLKEWTSADYQMEKQLSQLKKMLLSQGAHPKVFKSEGSSPSVAATGFPTNLRCGPGSGVPTESNCPADTAWVPETHNYGLWVWADLITSWGEASTQYAFGLKNIAHRQRCYTRNLLAYAYPTLPACTPDLSGLAAPCNDTNVIYVPKAAYESEIVVPNPSCIAIRSGTPLDKLLGCFYHDTWSSTAPGVTYIDTTLSDSNETYNAAVGAFNPELFMPNETYATHISFSSLGAADPRGLPFYVQGQLGTSDTFVPCIPGFEELCVFAVDTSVHFVDGTITSVP